MDRPHTQSTTVKVLVVTFIKAIPTTYQGVTFRSRLEARWAAFFDLCSIQWDYEPFDMDGWCPDFALHTRVGARVLTEVKPVALDWVKDVCPNGAYLMPEEDSGIFDKARRHARDEWVLLLGERPQSHADFFGIGTLLDPPRGEAGRWHAVKDELAAINSIGLWRQAGSIVQWVPA